MCLCEGVICGNKDHKVEDMNVKKIIAKVQELDDLLQENNLIRTRNIEAGSIDGTSKLNVELTIDTPDELEEEE